MAFKVMFGCGGQRSSVEGH